MENLTGIPNTSFVCTMGTIQYRILNFNNNKSTIYNQTQQATKFHYGTPKISRFSGSNQFPEPSIMGTSSSSDELLLNILKNSAKVIFYCPDRAKITDESPNEIKTSRSKRSVLIILSCQLAL